MKRLFALKENGHLFQGIPASNGPLCFETKKEAKLRRDEINKMGISRVHVTYGPDHRNFKGNIK